ncbi:MAG: DNA (cytosine-5-)-methyltransferase [Alphaproteobacteria bacterium]|nr:DNA (cytosine-5-)-methyltransferase [Alphaproteobacteria bacterium]MDA8010527.1 DNA (cytosine-5-)-methyltransferase [Alphaproteobacteria bacterium]MDA8030454.1 DNA (cytosine-5-)-methyltransferase [Alphaproteobacteria bacterium]
MRTFVDMFCGIGGFHLAAASTGMRCVFASDIDAEARKAYETNFNQKVRGDIRRIATHEVPEHDLLCAGFPCQPFSIIGKRRGFDDIRGTLFFDIVRILDAKRPQAAILENVRQLVSHNGGHTLKRIMEALREIGYAADYNVLNTLHFGLPQKRERVIIVAFLDQHAMREFQWPAGDARMKPLSEVLQRNVSARHNVSKRIRDKRRRAHTSPLRLGIWHENKGGNVNSHPYSCALRAGASYNYLLVNGERRLTPREMLRLQGFPDTFEIVCPDGQTRKQAGNAVSVPVIQRVIEEMQNATEQAASAWQKAVA